MLRTLNEERSRPIIRAIKKKQLPYVRRCRITVYIINVYRVTNWRKIEGGKKEVMKFWQMLWRKQDRMEQDRVYSSSETDLGHIRHYDDGTQQNDEKTFKN